jgi:hypothetical protein
MKKNEQIKSELEAIASEHGGMLRPSDVVAFARNPKTALHGRFEWDNDKAGDAYRLYQAREIIRVQVTVTDNNPIPIRAYVSLRDDRKQEDGGYRTMSDVMRTKNLREALLREAYNDMEIFLRKYEAIKQLAGVRRAIVKALPAVEKAIKPVRVNVQKSAHGNVAYA